MALAVPLDGTESMVGLQHLEAASLKQRLNQSASAQRPQRRQYKGPHILYATMDDLQAPPRPWRQFFGTLDQYNVPRSVVALADRAEANAVHYLPNYVRVVVAMLLLNLYLQPRALAAACVLLMTALVHASVGQHMPWVKHIMPALYVASMIIAQRGRCMVVAARWLMGSAVTVALHAGTRVSEWEVKARIQNSGGRMDLLWEVMGLARGGVVAMWVDGVLWVRRIADPRGWRLY